MAEHGPRTRRVIQSHPRGEVADSVAGDPAGVGPTPTERRAAGAPRSSDPPPWARALARLPTPSVLLPASRWAGTTLALARSERAARVARVAREWLGMDLSRADERDLVRRTFTSEVAQHLEMLRYPGLTLGTASNRGRAGPMASDWVHLRGEEHVLDALGTGRGLLLASSHLGHHRLAAVALAARGHAITELNLAPDDLAPELPRPSRLAAAFRRRDGWRTGPLGIERVPVNGWLRPALRVLQAGGILVSPGDGRWGRSFEAVPFAAGRVWLATGTARLAWLAGAAVVPCHVFRDERGHHEVRLGAGFAPAPGPGRGDEAAFTTETLRTYARGLEAAIRERPELYLWRLAVLHTLQESGRDRFFTV